MGSGSPGGDGGVSERTGLCCGADNTTRGAEVESRLWGGISGALPAGPGLPYTGSPVQELTLLRPSLVSHWLLWAASVLCINSVHINSFLTYLLSSF